MLRKLQTICHLVSSKLSAISILFNCAILYWRPPGGNECFHYVTWLVVTGHHQVTETKLCCLVFCTAASSAQREGKELLVQHLLVGEKDVRLLVDLEKSIIAGGTFWFLNYLYLYFTFGWSRNLVCIVIFSVPSLHTELWLIGNICSYQENDISENFRGRPEWFSCGALLMPIERKWWNAWVGSKGTDGTALTCSLAYWY
jgi:hypothetical protein